MRNQGLGPWPRSHAAGIISFGPGGRGSDLSSHRSRGLYAGLLFADSWARSSGIGRRQSAQGAIVNVNIGARSRKPSSSTSAPKRPFAVFRPARSSNTLVFLATYNERDAITPMIDALLGLPVDCDLFDRRRSFDRRDHRHSPFPCGLGAPSRDHGASGQARGRFGPYARLDARATMRIPTHRDARRRFLPRSC